MSQVEPTYVVGATSLYHVFFINIAVSSNNSANSTH